MSSSVLFDAPGPKTRRRLVVVNIVGTALVLGLTAWVVVALAGKGQLTAQKWSPFLTASPWLDYMLPGLWATVRAAALAVLTSNVIGLIFGIGRLSGNTAVRAVSGVVVEFFRAVPVLVLMIFFYFFFSLGGFVDPASAPYWGVVTGLTLYNGSVIAELVRSGVLNLPRGQSEAGLSIGLTEGQTLRSILIPQALVAMMPSMISQLVVILKDTALGYLITYSELLRMSRLVGTSYQNLVPALIVAAVVFIVINYALTVLAEALAARLGSRTSGEVLVLQNADEGITPGLDIVRTGPVDPAEHGHPRNP